MFHPTVFDNIKVVMEGAVYDRDFDGAILVTGRSDLVDLATYQRLFQIEFQLAGATNQDHAVTAQIQLRTQLADIAAEQLDKPLTEHIGCTVCIHFTLHITEIRSETEAITAALNEIWGHRPHITQLISARLNEHRPVWPPDRYANKITLDFHRKIDEGNIEDMRHLIEHCIQSLARLQALQR